MLDRRHDLQVGWGVRDVVDDADRIGNVIRHPDLPTVGPNGDADRINSDIDSLSDLARLAVNHVNCVSWRVHDEDISLVDSNW